VKSPLGCEGGCRHTATEGFRSTNRQAAATRKGLRLLLRLLALLSISLTQTAFAEIQPRINATDIYAGTPFSVTYELEGKGVDEPNLAPLADDFEVLGSVRSSHISLEKGAMHRRQHLTLTLASRRAGEVELPALSFGPERSAAITLTVREASAIPQDGEALALEVELTPDAVFVQEQLLMVVRVLRPAGVDLESARLSEPKVSGGDAVIETLGKDRAYRTQRAGESFEVIERRFAIIPQSSGELTVEPMRLDARRLSGSLSLSNPFGVRIDPVTLQSDARRVTVRRAPPEEAATGWLPARSLALTEAWSGLDDAGRARAGEPIVRTIGVLAEGLTAAQLPALQPPAPPGVNQYPDTPHLATQHNPDGVSAQRTERLVLIPTAAGAIELPAMEIHWWDLTEARRATASLPARRVEVLPAAGAVATTPAQPAISTQAEAPTATGQPTDAAPPPPANLDLGTGGSARPDSAHEFAWDALGWLSLGLLLGLILTRIKIRSVTWGMRSEPQPDRPSSSRRTSQLLANLGRAAARNDSQTAQRELIALAPFLVEAGGQPLCSLAALLERLPDGPLKDAVIELQRHRYGRPDAGQSTWDGRPLRDALRALRQAPARQQPSLQRAAWLPAIHPRG